MAEVGKLFLMVVGLVSILMVLFIIFSAGMEFPTSPSMGKILKESSRYMRCHMIEYATGYQATCRPSYISEFKRYLTDEEYRREKEKNMQWRIEQMKKDEFWEPLPNPFG